ncbi:MAG: hypothetical protein QXG97_01650 [Nitrososphaerota archaeon]
MTEEVSALDRKVRKAAKILFYKRHRQPGLKGWELKKALGKDYRRVIELLNQRLESLDLQVRVVFETTEGPTERSEEEYERARYYVTLKEPLSLSDVVLSGWRIDDVAALAATAAYILSREGKAPRKDVEALLKEKFPGWKIEHNLNRFIRNGYVGEDENGMLYLDWRSRAEIDGGLLLKLIIGETTQVLQPSAANHST